MKLIAATQNPDKLREFRDLTGLEFEITGLSDIEVAEELPEDQDTIEGNARQKAQYIYDRFGIDCFAEDTGLEIGALNGAPGVASARYAGPAKLAPDNIRLVLENMVDVDHRAARFVTVVALILKGQIFVFRGETTGVIVRQPAGTNGFGYDPIFRPDGYEETFAQMQSDLKNMISHRAKAISKMIGFLKGRSGSQ